MAHPELIPVAAKHRLPQVTEENREEASKQFKLVGEAFAVLSDPAQRRRYDAGWSLEVREG